MIRQLATILPFLVLVATAAPAQTMRTAPPQADPQVKQLLSLMDQDRNGKVSRAEFMAFMAAEFDRLDVNKDGELDVNVLSGLRVTRSTHTGGSGSI